MRSLFESTPSQKSPNPKSEKSKSQIETEMRVNEAMDMVNKMDFAAFKYEESDPVKFNREEVKSLYLGTIRWEQLILECVLIICFCTFSGWTDYADFKNMIGF